MAGRRRKSSRHHRHRRTKHTKHSRRTKHAKRVRRTRRGGDGSIGTPYPATRMMPLNQKKEEKEIPIENASTNCLFIKGELTTTTIMNKSRTIIILRKPESIRIVFFINCEPNTVLNPQSRKVKWIRPANNLKVIYFYQHVIIM